MVSIRHVDSTFAELQRLQDVGDLAEEIDRRMNELRLAARDFVTDPGAQSDRVGQAATALNTLLKKTRLELVPEQQNMLDGVTQRLANYRQGIERVSALIARREQLVAVVRAAVERSATQRRRLSAALAETYGHKIHLNVVLDPTVVGGISVQIGDELIDATAASRLAAVRRKLAG